MHVCLYFTSLILHKNWCLFAINVVSLARAVIHKDVCYVAKLILRLPLILVCKKFFVRCRRRHRHRVRFLLTLPSSLFDLFSICEILNFLHNFFSTVNSIFLLLCLFVWLVGDTKSCVYLQYYLNSKRAAITKLHRNKERYKFEIRDKCDRMRKETTDSFDFGSIFKWVKINLLFKMQTIESHIFMSDVESYLTPFFFLLFHIKHISTKQWRN